MAERKPPAGAPLSDDALDQATGGAEATQRSRVTSLTVTFSAQTTFNEGDPDQPIIVGSVHNPEKP